VPGGVAPEVVIASVELPGGVTGFVPKLADAPDGNPEVTVSVTAELKPLRLPNDTV